MNRTERLLATQELSSLLHEYWNDVDTNWGRTAPGYYTEDGIFEGPEATYVGREKIRAFYEWRVKRGARLAVHAVTNFRATFQNENQAICTWYMHLYAADGVPVLPTHPPIQIALVTDKMVRDASGNWLCAHRKFEAWFQGGTPPTNPKL